MGLLLKNLCWHDGTKSLKGDFRIDKDFIKELGDNLKPEKKDRVIDFTNHYIYPGLINSHDHLEMNLYSKLGIPPYNNYIEWAADIYKPTQSPLFEIEKVNIKDRLLWGGLKNLISGVTTVVHHNPWHRILGKKDFPVKVLKNITWSHSLAFGKNIQKSFPKKSNIPFVIHAAEGIDEVAFDEIKKLDALGLIKSNTVLIHGIALNDESINLLMQHQTSVVWCPASNDYMFRQTANINNLKMKIRVALGSDSTLTGSATLLDEIKVAINTGMATPGEIFQMVTSIPAGVFNLPSPQLKVSAKADLFITPIRHADYFENLVHLQPSEVSLMLIDGNVKLSDISLTNDLKLFGNKLKIQGAIKYIEPDAPSLINRIDKKVGKSIMEKNPIWQMLEVC